MDRCFAPALEQLLVGVAPWSPEAPAVVKAFINGRSGASVPVTDFHVFRAGAGEATFTIDVLATPKARRGRRPKTERDVRVRLLVEHWKRQGFDASEIHKCIALAIPGFSADPRGAIEKAAERAGKKFPELFPYRVD